MPTGTELTSRQLTSIKDAIEAGKKPREIRLAVGVSASPIQRVKRAMEEGKLDELLAHAPHASNGNGHAPRGKRGGSPVALGRKRPAVSDRLARVIVYKGKGWSHKDIAEKLGVTPATVGYYSSQARKRKLGNQQEEHTHGNSSGTFNKNIRLGIAYAETERFITLLSQRLELSPKILRPGLSKLLGHQAIR